ncbi:hypothetical protein GCM10009830_03090 [Glycomyces endophyticus]|uniref:Uncharacterized protein n=1 Tax=Glycomyces endophyticus TaxID=480996 RepID=A0ABN2FX16_9ACTN
MSCSTIPQPTAPKNRATQLVVHPSGYVLRTGPYDGFDPGPWLWRTENGYRRDTRTGRHRRYEAPDSFNRLRELAWDRFLESSEPLAQAHHPRPRPARRGPITEAVRRLAQKLRGRA